MNDRNISDIRKQIDIIDKEILQLLHKRLNYAKEIGRIKKENGEKTSPIQFFDPVREQEIYKCLLYTNKKTFPESSLQAIFNEIISACRTIQQD